MAKRQTKKPESKKAPASDSNRKRLIDDLAGKLEKIDAEGLQFLNKQADVLIYNAKVDELNRKIRQTVRPKAFAAPQSEGDVMIERTKDDFFYVEANGQRVFFNIEEMRALTRIAHGADDEATGARRLHRWFERERKDFLTDVGITSSTSEYLTRLHSVIVSTYKVKGK